MYNIIILGNYIYEYIYKRDSESLCNKLFDWLDSYML